MLLYSGMHGHLGGIPTLVHGSSCSNPTINLWFTKIQAVCREHQPQALRPTHSCPPGREGVSPLHCCSLALGSLHTPYCGPWMKDSTRDNFSGAPESVPSSAQPALSFLLFLILCGLPPNPNNLMTNYTTAKLNWLLHQIPWIIGKGKYIAH